MTDSLDPAAGRLSAIISDVRGSLGFTINRKEETGPGRLGIVSTDDDQPGDDSPEIEDRRADPDDRRERIAPPEPHEQTPPVVEAVAASRAVRAQAARSHRPEAVLDCPPSEATVDPEAELPAKKKGTFSLPLETLLTVKAYASVTKQAQCDIVAASVQEYLDDCEEELTEDQRHRIVELVARYEWRLRDRLARKRVGEGKEPSSSKAPGRKMEKRYDLAGRWSPPEDGRMAHFARVAMNRKTREHLGPEDES